MGCSLPSRFCCSCDILNASGRHDQGGGFYRLDADAELCRRTDLHRQSGIDDCVRSICMFCLAIEFTCCLIHKDAKKMGDQGANKPFSCSG